MKISFFLLSYILIGCKSFDRNIAADPRFSSGKLYGTSTPLKPIMYSFDDHTFVTGFPSSDGTASLGLFDGDKEIYYETATDGIYDTIIKANLNNDDLADYLVSFKYEDGASLFALVSSSKGFAKEILLDEWSEITCNVGADTLQYVLPLQKRDLDENGTDEIIINLFEIGRNTFSLPCTDTIFYRLR